MRRKIIRAQPSADQVKVARRKASLTATRDHLSEQLERWYRRLKRAFNTVDRIQKRISYCNKQITKLEEQP